MSPADQYDKLSIRELGSQFRRHSVSPRELTNECLRRIEIFNPRLNAFITVLAESALKDAERLERELLEGKDRGPLHGIPVGIKDIVDVGGVGTTAASAQYQERIASEDAEVTRRLRAAGAVVLGKQNLHEFAYGGSSMISYFGEVRNARDESRIAGGSSGGSATSVAAGLGCAAIGTDTAGSIRLPAAFCGVVGLKPTYGRVSTRGVVPLSWSYDHVGPITNFVADAAMMLQVLAGHDAEDPGSANVPVPNYLAAIEEFPRNLRIGIPRAFFFEELDGEIADTMENSMRIFRDLGCGVREIDLEVSTDRTLSSAESWAFHESMAKESPELYQPATLGRIKSGAVIAAGAALRAQRELFAMRRSIAAIFERVDVLLTPTVPTLPARIAALQEHPENLRPEELKILRNTRPFNVWGIPAITVPCGCTEDGLPIGLQLATAAWHEDLLLQVAHRFEKASGLS